MSGILKTKQQLLVLAFCWFQQNKRCSNVATSDAGPLLKIKEKIGNFFVTTNHAQIYNHTVNIQIAKQI